VKNNGYGDNPDNIMNLAQAMSAGRSLEAFLNEKRSQEAKKKVRKIKTLTETTPKHIYDFAIFELSICAFDIQSGWRDAYERQREYMKRDIFMEELNPENFSQILQDLSRYLDFIPIEKTSDNQKITKAYGKSLPEDEIRSIVGRVIPPEWTVNLLALGNEPRRFKNLEDQLNMYRWQWKVDQQNQSLLRCMERFQTSPMMEKEKIVIEIITTPTAGAVVLAKAILATEDTEDVEEAAVVAVGEQTIVSIYKMLNVSSVANRVTILLTAHSQERMTMNIQTWFPRRISKTCFNPH
jgi:hypothetical protein